jgi:UDP-glucose 4-epimerase
MPQILVTGGLGYIGSHTVVELLVAGFDVVIIDNLSNSSETVLNRIEKITNKRPVFYGGDIRDKNVLRNIFSHNKIDGVIHFAALKSVGESFEKRDEYFSVNVDGTRGLCEVMQEFNVFDLVFSSSAAVYGIIEHNPIPETALCAPTNPYGETKVACEKLLEEFAKNNSAWGVVMLRYFNPAGAHESALIGDSPKYPASIASMIMEVIAGKREMLVINGDDYDTVDGTCVRDFVHVVDLARAHIFALKFSMNNKGVHVFNVGTGKGCSVLQLVEAFSRAAGYEIPAVVGDRREGDIITAVADATKINTELGWHAEKTLEDIAQSSVAWLKKNPHGYEL